MFSASSRLLLHQLLRVCCHLLSFIHSLKDAWCQITPFVINVKCAVIHVKNPRRGHFLIGRHALFWSDIIKRWKGGVKVACAVMDGDGGSIENLVRRIIRSVQEPSADRQQNRRVQWPTTVTAKANSLTAKANKLNAIFSPSRVHQFSRSEPPSHSLYNFLTDEPPSHSL